MTSRSLKQADGIVLKFEFVRFSFFVSRSYVLFCFVVLSLPLYSQLLACLSSFTVMQSVIRYNMTTSKNGTTTRERKRKRKRKREDVEASVDSVSSYSK